MRVRLPILLLLLCSCATIPNRGKLMMKDVSFPMRDLRYPSGVRVVVEEDHRSPVVAVVVLVGAGASEDPQGKEGLAHLAEHLLFRGSARGTTAWTALHRAGAVGLNAFTQPDVTVYFETGPKEALGELLKIEGERFAAPLLKVDEQTFLVEREVVRNEIRQRGETGYSGQAIDWLREALFPKGHPYARSVGGSHQSLSAITFDDVRGWIRKHYRPENLTVVISGDVDLQAVDQVVAAQLPGSLLHGAPGPYAVRPRFTGAAPELPAPPPLVLAKRQGAVPTPELWVGWTLPRAFDSDAYLVDFAVEKAKSALYGAYRADPDIASVGVFVIPGAEATVLVAYVPLNDGKNPERSLEAVLDQIYKSWFVDRADLEREVIFSKDRFAAITQLTVAADDLLDRSVDRAQFTHFAADPTLYSRAMRAISQLQPGTVGAFAAKYLTRQRARAVFIAPLPPDAVPPEGAAGLTAELAAEPGITFPVDQLAGRVAALRFPPPRMVTLPNGLTLVIAPRPGIPIATVGLGLKGGELAAPPGVVRMGEWVIDDGSHLNGHPYDFGGSLGRESGPDDFRYVMRGASGNLVNMLAILSERVPTMKAPEWLPMMQQEFMPHWVTVDQLPELRASRALAHALYPEHPAGRPTTMKDMSQVSAWAISDWIHASHVPQNAVLVITGDVDADEAQKLATQWFGGWSGKGAAIAAPSGAPKPPAERVLITHRPGATQGELQVACRLPAAPSGPPPEFELMSRLAAEELRLVLREQLGATYGAYPSLEVHRGGAAASTWTTIVENAKVGKALEVIRVTLQRLAAGVDPAALDRVRWTVAHEAALAPRTSARTLDALLTAATRDFDLVEQVSYPEALAKTPPEKVQAAFAACVQNGLVLSIVGDQKLAEQAVESAAWR